MTPIVDAERPLARHDFALPTTLGGMSLQAEPDRAGDAAAEIEVALLSDASAPDRVATRRATSIAHTTGGRLRHVARAPGPVGPWLDACTGADLIVTGTRDDGWCDALVGSTAERIARVARTPVLLVRQPARGHYRRALVAIDFSPASVAAIALARRLLPQASLVLMHALELPLEGKLGYAGVATAAIERYREAARRRARRRLSDLADGVRRQPPTEIVVAEGAPPARLIARVADERRCELVVIGKQGRHPLDELLLGSTARGVVAGTGFDVLLATPAAEVATRRRREASGRPLA